MPTSNPNSSNPFDAIELLDPAVVQMREDAANQMNKARGVVIEDLTDHIIDIKYTWTTQGASLLEVDIFDPQWTLLTPIEPLGGQAFIDVDPSGFLYDIKLELPVGSGHIWHLCSADVSITLDGANITLQFEDSVIQALRNAGASPTNAINSLPNETRLEFIQRICNGIKLPVVQWFSQQTKNFEKPPQPPTNQQIAAWNKHFNQQFDQNFNKKFDAAFNKKWLQQQAQAKQNSIKSKSFQMGTNPTGSMAQLHYWDKTDPGAQNPNSGSYIPNASYIPGLGTNP